MKKKINFTIILMTICLFVTSTLFAVDGTWALVNDPADGYWTNAANWTGGIPGANDVAYFTNVTTDSKITVTLANSENITVGGIALNNTRVQLPNPAQAPDGFGTNITLDASGSTPIINVNSNRLDIQAILEGTDGFIAYGASTNRSYIINPWTTEYGEQILGTLMIGATPKPISGTITYTNVLVVNNHNETHMNADLVVGENAVFNSQKKEFNAKTITVKDVGGSSVNNAGCFNAYTVSGDDLPPQLVKADSITVESGGVLGSGLWNGNLAGGVDFELLSPSININSGGRIKINATGTKTVSGSNIVVNSGGEVGFFGHDQTYILNNPLVLEGFGIAPALGALTVQSLSDLTNNGPITLTGSTRIGMWGGGDQYMVLNGPISGTGPLNLLAQGGHHSHIRRIELHGKNNYTGGTTIQGYAAQNITTLYGNNRLPNTTLTLEVSDWVQDTTNIFDLNGYDQDLQQLIIKAGAGFDDIKIIGGGGTINATGVANYGALMDGNAVSLHGVTFDVGNSIIALRSNIELTVTDSTVRTEGNLGYILMNHGNGNSTINVGEDGIVDVQLLRMADRSGDLKWQSAVNLNAGGLIKTAYIWVDGTNINMGSVFRHNGGILESHPVAAFSANWMLGNLSNIIAAGGANIKVHDDMTILAPFLHDPAVGGTDGGLTKLGSANLILPTVCEYTGPTVVSEGTLVIDGGITSSSSISVEPDAAIGGSGTINGFSLASGGAIAPGNGIGTLNVNSDLTLEAGSLYNWEVTSNQIADLVNITGNLIVPATANSVTVNVSKIGTEVSENQMVLFTTTGGGVDVNSIFLKYSGLGGPEHPSISGNNIIVSGLAPVPEPPENISATEGDYADKVAINWDESDEATKYQVWRSETDDSSTASANSDEMVTNFFDDITTAQQTFYYYWVKAGNDYGWSDFSDSALGFCTASTGPNQPTNSLPVDGAIISKSEFPVTLEMEPYFDSLGFPMVSIQWQMEDKNNFSRPNWDSGELSTTDVTIELQTSLLDATNYWRARFKNSWNRWSDWSEPTLFTTARNLSSPFYFFDTFNNVSGSGNVNKDYTVSGRQYGRIVPIEYSFTNSTEVGAAATNPNELTLGAAAACSPNQSFEESSKFMVGVKIKPGDSGSAITFGKASQNLPANSIGGFGVIFYGDNSGRYDVYSSENLVGTFTNDIVKAGELDVLFSASTIGYDNDPAYISLTVNGTPLVLNREWLTEAETNLYDRWAYTYAYEKFNGFDKNFVTLYNYNEVGIFDDLKISTVKAKCFTRTWGNNDDTWIGLSNSIADFTHAVNINADGILNVNGLDFIGGGEETSSWRTADTVPACSGSKWASFNSGGYMAWWSQNPPCSGTGAEIAERGWYGWSCSVGIILSNLVPNSENVLNLYGSPFGAATDRISYLSGSDGGLFEINGNEVTTKCQIIEYEFTAGNDGTFTIIFTPEPAQDYFLYGFSSYMKSVESPKISVASYLDFGETGFDGESKSLDIFNAGGGIVSGKVSFATADAFFSVSKSDYSAAATFDTIEVTFIPDDYIDYTNYLYLTGSGTNGVVEVLLTGTGVPEGGILLTILFSVFGIFFAMRK